MTPDARTREFVVTAYRLADERRAAAVRVPQLLRDTPHDELCDLACRPDLQTAGALELLSAAITAAHANNPQYALVLSELALSIAKTLPTNVYPAIIMAQLRAHALKDTGKSLRFLGRYDEALALFHEAEDELRRFSTLAHDTAIIHVNIAVVLQETNRCHTSLELLVSAKQTFRNHGDTENVVRCALLEGTLLQRLRKYREAREAYLLLLAAARDISKESRAALHLAIGLSSIELSDFADAEDNLEQAATLFAALSQPLNAVKAELGRGRLFLRQGDYAKAIRHLRPVRRHFLRSALAEEAGLCGLEIVQALLIIGRSGEAEQLARKIVHELTLARLSGRAIAALAYLADAVTQNTASAKLAHEVYEYIVSLRTDPERDFHLPQPI